MQVQGINVTGSNMSTVMDRLYTLPAAFDYSERDHFRERPLFPYTKNEQIENLFKEINSYRKKRTLHLMI